MNRSSGLLRRMFWRAFQDLIDDRVKFLILHQHLVFGNEDRVNIDSTSIVNNALLNTVSGNIIIGEHVFFGHGVSLLTGSHPTDLRGRDRMWTSPTTGNDIVIHDGVWLASNVTILGPCEVGHDAVVAAGAVVCSDVEAGTLVGGVPAKLIRRLF